MNHWKNHERTGRTTRMLSHAAFMCHTMKGITIFGMHTEHLRQLQEQFTHFLMAHNLTFKTSGMQITVGRGDRARCVVEFKPLTFNEFYQGPNDDKNAVFMDHAAIQRLIETPLNESHRWDLL